MVDGSTESQINDLVAAEPPAEAATLEGWVALVDWVMPTGEHRLVLLGRPKDHLLQLKGYVHDGIWKMVRGSYGELE